MAVVLAMLWKDELWELLGMPLVVSAAEATLLNCASLLKCA